MPFGLAIWVFLVVKSMDVLSIDMKLFAVHVICLKLTLPETNIAPKTGWLEYYFPIGIRPIFRGKLLVSGRVYSNWKVDSMGFPSLIV